MNRSIVICEEEKYAEAFAAFLTQKPELALQVQICCTLMQLAAIQAENPIDILVIGYSFVKEAAEKREMAAIEGIAAEKRFVLAENEELEAAVDGRILYKYQSGEAILAEIVGQCQGSGAEELFLQTIKKEKMKIIGVFSPVHRIGKTGYALELGKKLASSFNVLYLNMEIYGGIGGHFLEEGQNLADVLYYSRQERKHMGMILASIVKHMGALDYVLPVRVSEDVKTTDLKDWTNLVMQIAKDSIYDILILDIDEGLQEVYGILRLCTEIHMLTSAAETARAKLFQVEEELKILGYEDVKRKLIKKDVDL